jgi:hypothetical protein
MQFFKFHVEPTDGGKVVKYRPYSVGEDGNQYEGEEKVLPVSGLLDVRVTTGSLLPFARADKENKALSLFDRGIIDEEEVLKSLDYPNYEAVLQRVNEKKALLAQQQQVPQ